MFSLIALYSNVNFFCCVNAIGCIFVDNAVSVNDTSNDRHVFMTALAIPLPVLIEPYAKNYTCIHFRRTTKICSLNS